MKNPHATRINKISFCRLTPAVNCTIAWIGQILGQMASRLVGVLGLVGCRTTLVWLQISYQFFFLFHFLSLLNSIHLNKASETYFYVWYKLYEAIKTLNNGRIAIGVLLP